MRINRLDLLRYGKFTDRSIFLPQSNQDFHLIIGPNEAGKSTIRSAILDLFFGVENRSAYNFLHEYPDMKLGALIQQETNSLEFQRTKATKQSLFDIQGKSLSNEALHSFLGVTDRGYFDQMFGLNHDKLVTGGNEILNESSDIGQILFQAAAGIEGLGAARAALEIEADKLWSERKSKDRAYYAALDEFNEAKAELKRVTVKTKDWVEVQARVQQLEDALDQSRADYKNLAVQRNRLERVRRVAGLLEALQEKESALGRLGGTIILPVDTEKQFNKTVQTLANAQHEYGVYKGHAQNIQNRLTYIQPDNNLLKFVTEIQTLAEQQSLIRKYQTDIIKQQEAVKSHQKQVKKLLRQLDWSVEDEHILSKHLPTLSVRTKLASLLKRYDTLHHNFLSSKQSVDDKAREIKLLHDQIASLPATTVSAELRAALSTAQNLGDINSRTKQLEEQLIKANNVLKTEQAGLGRWNLDVDELSNLALPAVTTIASFHKRFTHSESMVGQLTMKLEENAEMILAKEFEITQYRKAHQTVTSEEVRVSRETRDAVWVSIKTGKASLQEMAAIYEDKVNDADLNADNRYDKAQEASVLLSELHHLEKLQQQHKRYQERLEVSQAELLTVKQEWMATIKEMRFPSIPLLEINQWLHAREKVIVASNNVEETRQLLTRWQREVEEAKEALLSYFKVDKVNADETMSLSTLIIMAADAKERVVHRQARWDELTKHRETAIAAMMVLKGNATTAQYEMTQWRSAWQEALELAGIQRESEISVVEGMLSLFNEMDNTLNDIDELRERHIKPMQMDLDNFEKEATVLKANLAPELDGLSSSDIVKELVDRLERAKSDQKEKNRLKQEQIVSEQKQDEISIKVDKATYEIQSLWKLAKVNSNEALQNVIKRSNECQNLNEAIVTLNKELEEKGDGLTHAQLMTEYEATNIAEIKTNQEILEQKQQDIQQQQNTLSADLATAKSAFSEIAGQDDAMRAESMRQDALAKMADVTARYIKVSTASKLLQWAINRYRETKQGPMLTRTSQLFEGLTLGSFQKLVVDFDEQPLTLKGQRDNGKTVNISGMSDGTRDQLYLALRLAALELHFEQSQSLPFILDDLFINFDDARVKAGLKALVNLSEKTQIIFLSHHDHIVSIVQAVFGREVNIVRL